MYKYAVLLGLIDLCMEHSSPDGSAPTAVTTQDLARKILEIYWPQTSAFAARDQAKILAQNTKGQAEILRLITRFRERHAPDPSAPLSQVRLHAKERFERLVREIEWKLVEMPLPRLQTVGTADDPFLYRIGWTRDVKRAEFVSPSFDNRIRLIEGGGDYLVQLAGLLRPLVQRQWARMVSRLNADVVQDARLEEFLFGATRIPLDKVRELLRDFQEKPLLLLRHFDPRPSRGGPLHPMGPSSRQRDRKPGLRRRALQQRQAGLRRVDRASAAMESRPLRCRRAPRRASRADFFDAGLGESSPSNACRRALDLPAPPRENEALGSRQSVHGAQPGSREGRSRRGGGIVLETKGDRARLPGQVWQIAPSPCYRQQGAPPTRRTSAR
jgi:hypothetical protein